MNIISAIVLAFITVLVIIVGLQVSIGVFSSPALKEIIDRQCESQYTTCLAERHVDCTHAELVNGSVCTAAELSDFAPYYMTTRRFTLDEFNATCKCVINTVWT